MHEVAKQHQEHLDDFKEIVERWDEYFRDNVKRYHNFKRFVFDSSLDQGEINTLQELGKPTIEFNITESYISRLRGEFAKQQPSLKVRAADGVPVSMLTPLFNQTLRIIEAHLRAQFFDGDNDYMGYNIYSDLLSGGFSVARVYTEYVNEMSSEQNIKVERVFDPTLCGFDPLARDSHKGDGRYCFEMFPMPRKEFEELYGKDLANTMGYSKNIGGFGWSYKNEKEDIVLVCDLYQKKKKKTKIVKLTNGHTVTKKEYEKVMERLQNNWQEYGIETPPEIISERMTTIETIERYRFCENTVLDHKKTNYKHLPLVFIDGNSVNLTTGDSTSQMTRPYVYHARGIQRLKNYAGQSLANELENLVQHKFIVALESIPTDYLEAYKDVQKSDTLIYNHFLDKKSPEVVLPPPREVVRPPIPPQISETFRMSDEMTQAILGSYDHAQGMNRADLSGIAIARGAMQSNTASIPYLVGYIKGLNRIAEIMVDLIPKYYRTPRSLPILKSDGKRDYVEINTPKSNLYMNYDPHSLQVKVETGVNFAIQKELALQTINELMRSSPMFASMMNEVGLPILLDNIDIRGVEELKEKAQEFMKKELGQQQQAKQMQQHQSEMQNKAQQIQLAEGEKRLQSPTKEQLDVAKFAHQKQVDEAELNLKAQQVQDSFLEVISKIRDNEVDAEVKQARIDAENTRTAIDSTIALDKHMQEVHTPKDER